MDTAYLWWLLALVIAGGSMVAFLAVGRIPEIEDEPPEDPAGHGADARHRATAAAAAAETTGGRVQSAPVSTTVPGSEDPSVTSDTP